MATAFNIAFLSLFSGHTALGTIEQKSKFPIYFSDMGEGEVLLFICRSITKYMQRQNSTRSYQFHCQYNCQHPYPVRLCYLTPFLQQSFATMYLSWKAQTLNSLLRGIRGFQGSATYFSLHHLLHSTSGNSPGLPQHNL